jgi:ABC-2 type transport system permease protein
MEYRASFAAQVLGMVLNNAAFIVFWLILYGQLGSIRGYSFGDVMFLWALAAAGYGLAGIFLGNAHSLSRSVYTADLDVYLLQPRSVLANFLLSRMSISAWGDLGYGIVLYLFTQPLTPGHAGLFVLFSLLMAVVLTSLRVLYHSLTFFLGNAEEFAGMASDMVLSFTLYPGSIFQGPVNLLLHSLIPAALIAYIPVELFKSFDAGRLLLLTAGDAAIALAAWGLFRLGLRVYESGSRMGARL